MRHKFRPTFLVLLFFLAWIGATLAPASELEDAVKADDVRRVEVLIAAGVDVNVEDVFFGTPLHIAVARNSVEITGLLLDAGANIESEASSSQHKAHPLHTAALANSPDAAALLIARGAVVESLDSTGATPLRVAASSGSTDVVKVLLQAGANPLAEDKDYADTPYYFAAMNGHLAVVRLFLTQGIDINVRNSRTGETALWGAAADSRLDVIEYLLLNGADPSIADSKGKSPIMVTNSPQAKELLRKYGAKD